MALHLEDHDIAIVEIDDARVLAGADDDPLAGRRQPLQMQPRGFVGAVFAPHDGEDSELDDGGLAAENGKDPLVLVALEAVLGDELGCDDELLGGLGNGFDGAGLERLGLSLRLGLAGDHFELSFLVGTAGRSLIAGGSEVVAMC